MITYDREKAREAVQYLVDSSYFHLHVKKLRNTVGRPRSLPFREDAEALNELLLIGRQNQLAMENLISVAEHKRGGKTEYQRQYMAAKRKRDRKVVKLEEILTGGRLDAAQRKQLLKRQYTVWHKERDQLLEENSDLSWTERNELIRDFWARKDRELDVLIEDAKLDPG